MKYPFYLPLIVGLTDSFTRSRIYSCLSRRRQAEHDEAYRLLNTFTLRFKEKSVESAFAENNLQRLCSSLFIIGATMVGFVVATMPFQPEYTTATGVKMQKLTAGFDWFLLAFGVVVAVCAKVQQVRPLANALGVEIFVSVMSMLALWLAVFADTWYMAKAYGVKDPHETLGATTCIYDALVPHAVMLVTAATHCTLPLRWSVLWTAEVGCALTYPILAIFLGVPHPAHVYYNTAVIWMFIILLMVGRRSAERFERKVFAQSIKERTMRVQTEFKLEISLEKEKYLEQTILTGRNGSESGASTGFLFGCIPPEYVVQRLQKFAEIGASEKWLVQTSQVELAPDRVLGKGGFGIVVAASYLGTLVAAKMSRNLRGLIGTMAATQVQDLANELRVMRHVRHPNVVAFYGAIIDVQRCQLAIIMEFVQGPTLKAFVRKHRDKTNPEWDNARYCVLRGIVAALRFMHDRHPMIVHGDLKPGNMLVVDNGCASQVCPRILDFGLSRVLSSYAKPMGGTRAWCAPEILSHLDRTPRPAVDVYSLGRIWYFVATGSVPLAEDPFQEPLSLAWPQDIMPFAKACQAIVEECTQFLQSDRPPVSLVCEKLRAWPRQPDLEHLRDPWMMVFAPAGNAEPLADTALLPWSEGVPQLERALLAAEVHGGTTPAVAEVLGGITPAAAVDSHRKRSLFEEQTPRGKCRDQSLIGTTIGQSTKGEKKESSLPPAEHLRRFASLPSSLAGSFTPTPEATKLVMLMDVAGRWVLENKHQTGSDAISRMHALTEAIARLRDLGSTRSKPSVYNDQCPKCFVLRGSGRGHVPCDICGVAAPLAAQGPGQVASPRQGSPAGLRCSL